MTVIAIEGLSGSGKSTFAGALVAKLRSLGLAVLHVGGMQEMGIANPINDFVAARFLQEDRFIRLPFWSETFLLLSNMAFNSETARQQRPDVVVRENYIAGLQAFQFARAQETAIDPANSVRHSLMMIPALTGATAPATTYWTFTPLELIAERLRRRERNGQLAYTENDQALQELILNEYQRVLARYSDTIEVDNEGTIEALVNKAEHEASAWYDKRGPKIASAPTIYIAGPLFSTAERSFLESLDREVVARGFRTYLPHRDGGLARTDDSGRTAGFFQADVHALVQCDCVLAVLSGPDVDSGTAWELGFAYALGKPLFGLYDDTREMDLNLMIINSSHIFRTQAELLSAVAAQVSTVV